MSQKAKIALLLHIVQLLYILNWNWSQLFYVEKLVQNQYAQAKMHIWGQWAASKLKYVASYYLNSAVVEQLNQKKKSSFEVVVWLQTATSCIKIKHAAVSGQS